MPSPVGHSLLGLAIGVWAVLPPGPLRGIASEAMRRRWALAGAVALANAPDVDYVPGLLTGDFNAYHHLLTHTLGWCVLVSAACWFLARAVLPAARAAALFGWCLALTGSHLLADWLTDDTRPPIGIMALWPLDDRFLLAPHTIFWRLLKRDFSEVLQWHNAQAVGVEIAWCLPLLFLAVVLRWKQNAAR